MECEIVNYYTIDCFAEKYKYLDLLRTEDYHDYGWLH